MKQDDDDDDDDDDDAQDEWHPLTIVTVIVLVPTIVTEYPQQLRLLIITNAIVVHLHHYNYLPSFLLVAVILIL